jgi:regulator of PEP synthase PpsR (kinase-PPPase family)
MLKDLDVPVMNTTNQSIEEISSLILRALETSPNG